MAWNGSEKFVPKYVQTKPKEEKKQVSSFYDDFQTRRAENSKSIGEKNPVTKAVSKSKTSNSKKSATTSHTEPKSDLKFNGGYQSYADRKKNGRVFTPSTVLGRKMSEPAPITKLDGLTDELNTKLNKIVDDYYDIRNNKNLSATEFNQAISDLMKNNSGALDEFAKQSGMPRDKVTIPGLQYRFKEQRKKDYQTKLNTAYENRVKRHYDLGNREDFFAVVNSALPEEKRVAENRVEKVFSNAEFVNPSDLHEYESARLPDYYGPQSGVHSKVKGVDDSDVNLLYMTEYERLIYKYYLKKYGVKEADEYIKDIETFLDKRRTDAHSTITHKYSNDHKALGVLSDVIYSMAQFPAYLDAGVQSIVQDNSTLQNYRPYNPYTEATQAVHGQSAAREGVTQDMSTVGKGVTNLGLGVAENVARLPLGVAGLPLMGLNVAGQSTVDRGLKGETDAGKAFQTGTTKGTIEMATEWLPLDNVLKVMKSPPSTVKEAVVTVLKNAGIEGTEEAISNIAGNISDKVINGDTSDFERYKQGLMEQGMSEGEALTKAFWEYYVVDTIEAGGQGFLSGLVMNTGATTAGYVNNTIETGRAINDSGGGQAVVNAGLKRDSATDANKYAQKMQTKQEGGGTLSNWNVGRQFQKNVQAFQAEKDIIGSIKEQLGIDVELSPYLADDKGNALNGRYDGNNRIDISKNGDASAPATLGHEVLHYLRNNAPDVYNQMKSYVSEMILNDEDNGFKERYKHHRKNYKYSPDVAIEEVVADLAESMFGKKSSIDSMVKNNPKMVQSVLDGIKSTKAKIKDRFLAPNTNRTGLKTTYAQLDKFERMYYDGLRTASQNKGNEGSGETRQSVIEHPTPETLNSGIINEDVLNQYKADVDRVLNGTYTQSSVLKMGGTPKVMTDIGLNKLPFTIDKGHVYSIAKTEQEAKAEGKYQRGVNYHGLGADAVKDILEKVSTPIAIVAHPDFVKRTERDSAHKVIVLVDLSIDGRNVVAPIEVDKDVMLNGIGVDANNVATYFDKRNISDILKEAVALENQKKTGFYYADKKRVEALLNVSGYQLPSSIRTHNSNIIIRHIDDNVNRKIDTVLKSRQFKDWFGDWQNDPENASKVVNDDGTPKVVYHGTGEEFYVFDKSLQGSNTGAQSAKKAIFFTSSRKVAEGYAKDARPKNITELYNKAERLENSAFYTGDYSKAEEAWREYEEAELQYKGEGKVMSAYLDMKNPLVYDFEGNEYREVTYNDLLKKALNNGNDGVIFLNTYDASNNAHDEMTDVYAVFDSTQVKSATDNIGTFDKNNPDIRYSYAGEHAQTANFEELQKAMAMDEKGIDAQTIWKQTGWGKGQDGLWRFEIDDSEAEYIGPDFEGLHHSFKLSEVLKHDKLYEAYPELKNLPVGIGSSKAGLIDGNGSYAPISNLIFLDKDLSNEEKREVLLHEAQHAIQVIENFAVGADYKEDGAEKYWRSAGELEARDVKTRADMTMKERRNTFPESMEKYTGLEVIQWHDHPDYEMKQEIEARIKAEKEKQRQKNRERYQRRKQQELERKAQSKMDDAGVRFSVAEGAGNTYTPNRVARRLIDDYDAKGNVYVKDIQNDITSLARKVNDVFGSDDVETKYPAFEAEARVLAEQIIGASKNTNSYQKAEYDNLRKWLKDSRIKITDELKSDIPDFNDYRKRLMGTVYFSNDGTPIDILYKDLQEQFPQYFDEQEQTTQSDQLTHLVDVIQNLKQFETGIADDDYDDMVDELKDRIILDAMNLSSYIQPEPATQPETESVPEMATDSEAEMPMPPIEAYEEPPERTNRTQRGRQNQYNEVNAQQKVQDLMREQGVSSPSELSPDTVTREQSKKDRNIFRGRQGIRNFMSRAYTLVVDDMHPFWNYNKAYEKTSSQTNYGKENPYKLAINAKDASSRSAYIVSDKMVDFDNNEVGEGLVNTITNGGITEKNYNDFNNYLVARHALEWLDPDEHGSFKNVYENPALNDVDVVLAMIADFEHKNPEFKQAAESLYEWQRQLMKTWLVDTGVITQEQYDRFTEMYPDYVPFFREQNVQMSRNATGGFANQGNPFKQAVGTQERRILQPIENIMYNVASYVNHATKHAVTSSAVRLYDILESDPENNVLRQYWEEVEPVNPDDGKPQYFRTKDSDSVDIQDVTQEEENSISQTLREQMGVQDGVVTIIDNGRRRYFRVNDADFLTVLDNVKPKMRDGFLSIMASFSRTRAALITSWNPAFSLASNPMRDFGTLITNSSDANKAKVVKEALSAYVDVAKSSEAYKQYLSMGGQYSSVTTEGMDAMKLAMQKLKAKDPNMAKRFFKLFPKMFNGYQTISDAIESAPRMSEFKTTLDKGYDFHEAFFRAKDVTTNFSRGGKIAKDINSISNFFNASIQGVDKFFRQAKNNPKSFAIGVSCLAAIELLAWAWNTAGDDEEKEEAYDNLSNYTKNNFYNFYIGGGEFISIPKARESAVLATSIGATLNSMVNEQDDRFKGFFSEYIKSQFIPDWSLVGYSTYKDLSSNKDYLGRPIVSAELEKLPAELQYDDDTSYFAKWLGGVIKQSPKQIDHIINSEAGVLGKVNRTYFSPSGQQDKATMFTFGVNTTFNKDSLFSTDHPTFFYNNKEEAEKQANGYPSADNGYLSNRYYQAGSVMGILNEIYKEDTESDAGREMRRAYVNYAKEYKKNPMGLSDDVYNEIKDLYDANADALKMPTVQRELKMKIGKENKSFVFSDAESVINYQKDLNKGVDEAYRKLLSDVSYNAMSDLEKAEALNDARADATKAVKKFYIENDGKLRMYNDDGSTSITEPSKADIDRYRQKMEHQEEVTGYLQTIADNVAKAVPDKADDYSVTSMQINDIQSAKIDGKSYKISGEIEKKVIETANDVHYSNVEKLMNNEINVQDAVGYTPKGRARTFTQADGTKVQLTGKLYNADGTPRFDETAIAQIMKLTKETAKDQAIEQYKDEITGGATPTFTPTPTSNTSSTKVSSNTASSGEHRRFTSAKASGGSSSKATAQTGNKVRFTGRANTTPTRRMQTASAHLPNVVTPKAANTDIMQQAVNSFMKNAEIKPIQPLKNPLTM